jgi:hypothetical protein
MQSNPLRWETADMSFIDHCQDLKECGDTKLAWLRQYREFAHGIPVDDTNARVITHCQKRTPALIRTGRARSVPVGRWRTKVRCVPDVTYLEDQLWNRRGDGADNLRLLRRFCLNLSRLHPKKDSIRGQLKSARRNDQSRAELLFGVQMSTYAFALAAEDHME